MLGKINFTDSERQMLASAINSFGDGKHPMASEKTLPFFTLDYAKSCIEKAQAVVKPSFRATLDAIRAKLG